MVTAILQIADRVHSRVDYLTELDSELGDGDHGISLDRGFSEVRRKLSGFDGTDVGAVLELAGASLVSSMGGAAGPIFGTAFSSAGNAVKGRSRVGVAEVAAMFEAAESAVVNLGRAKVGDKTVLDALHPAATAAKEASDRGESDLVNAFGSIVAAANSGLETTKVLVAKKGRAMYLGERGIGTYDVGAASFCIMLESVLESLRRLDDEKQSVDAP
jgi:phosphoenolpyruvate---glycerone phosphotransferase subunit DhaL